MMNISDLPYHIQDKIKKEYRLLLPSKSQEYKSVVNQIKTISWEFKTLCNRVYDECDDIDMFMGIENIEYCILYDLKSLDNLPYIYCIDDIIENYELYTLLLEIGMKRFIYIF